MALIGIDIRKLSDYGIGTYIRNLIKAIAELDRNSEYLLLHKPGEDLSGLPAGMRRAEERAGLYSIGEPYRLGRRARKEKLDLLHCPHYVTPFKHKCALAVTIHDLIHMLFPQYLPNRAAYFYARFFLKRAAKRADVILTVSETTKNDILAHLPAREERVVVTPNAVDPQFTREISGEELERARQRYILHKPFILYAGSIKPHKNLTMAVEAFARFRRRAGGEWRLVIVGSGSAGKELYRKIGQEGVRDAVRFLGFIPYGDLPAVYKLANLFLFPSLYEGFGLPPLEAMAVGTPVVASNRSSLPEVLGQAALLTHPHDAAETAEAIERAVSDQQLREKLIDRGLERVRQYSWLKTAEKTLESYRQALGMS